MAVLLSFVKEHWETWCQFTVQWECKTTKSGSLHGSVAVAHSDLDSPSAGPWACAKGTPDTPGPLYWNRFMLFMDAQAMFTMLQARSKHRKDEIIAEPVSAACLL